MNNRTKKYLTLLIKLLITLGALYFVFRKIDVKDTWEMIKTSNPFYLFWACILFILSKIISSFRLNSYLRNIGVFLSERYNLRLYWLGMFYNLSLPGGIGGDGYKVYFLNKRHPVKFVDVFWAVMLDRVIGVLALFCLAVLFLYFVPYQFRLKTLTGVLIPVSIFCTYYLIRYFFKKHLLVFWITNMQSFLVQLLQVLSAFFILLSLGVDDNITSYLFVFLLSSIVAVLPITVGGLGSREITFFWGAEILGLNNNLSVALSLLFYVITALVSLFGIYYMIKPQKLGKFLHKDPVNV